MDDYISREAAIETVINYEFENCPDYMRDFATKIKSAVCSDIRTDLQALPAADVRPVVRARWIELDDHSICSSCGAPNYGKDKNYCPNCGADMRGIENGA